MNKLFIIAKCTLVLFLFTLSCYNTSSAQDSSYQRLLLNASSNILLFNLKDSINSWINNSYKSDIVLKKMLNKNSNIYKVYSELNRFSNKEEIPKYNEAIREIENYLSDKGISYDKIDLKNRFRNFYENHKVVNIATEYPQNPNQKAGDEKEIISSNGTPINFWKYISIMLATIITGLLFFITRRNIKKSDSLAVRTIKTSKVTSQQLAAKATNVVANPSSSTNMKPFPVIMGNQWTVMAASAIGLQHIKSNPAIPCQDSFSEKILGGGWGIAVVCDGAGSKKNSHIGSRFVAEQTILEFEKIIKDNKLIEEKRLPDEAAWKVLCKKVFSKILMDNLKIFAENEAIELDSLGCTVILVIYSPFGIMASHIGDGRAGYRNEKGDWKPLITPHKGEEANQTIFITTPAWCNEENLQVSGVSVPESIVVSEKPTAFTLMSDGCENHAFQTGYFDKVKQLLISQNQPYPDFFNPIVGTIQEMKKKGISPADMQMKWQLFLETGNAGLKNEPDDKTLILGILTD